MHKVSMAVLTVFGVILATSSIGAKQMGQPSQGAPVSQVTPINQVTPVNQGPQAGVHPELDNDDSRRPGHDRLEAEAARGRNTDRHKRLVEDTNKLFQLSTELKSEVDKSTKDEMSVQVIQKAAAIEKLAHDVKERMKG